MAYQALQDTMEAAGMVGIPVYFLVLITIGPSQDSFSNVNSMVEQVASYQFLSAPSPTTCILLCTVSIVLRRRDAVLKSMYLQLCMGTQRIQVLPSLTNVSPGNTVYFGGLEKLFVNPRVERTWLDNITATVCVYGFPYFISFCIFSIMVRALNS